MNPPKIDRAVAALKGLFGREGRVRSAILYGSCARGTARDDSDIDVLVLVSGGGVGRLREAIHDIESVHEVNVSPLILRADEVDRLDPQFLESILRERVPLAGNLPAASLRDLRLRPIRVVSIDVSHLPQSEKVRLSPASWMATRRSAAEAESGTSERWAGSSGKSAAGGWGGERSSSRNGPSRGSRKSCPG